MSVKQVIPIRSSLLLIWILHDMKISNKAKMICLKIINKKIKISDVQSYVKDINLKIKKYMNE